MSLYHILSILFIYDELFLVVVERNEKNLIEIKVIKFWISYVFRYLEEMGLVEREAEMQELNAPRPGRSRDLFGVQLEVRIVW